MRSGWGALRGNRPADRRRPAVASLCLAILASLAAAASSPAAPQPYGTNDAGGFRNVLPPGADGIDNALELAAFQATGAYPEHWDDQQPLYDGLIGAEPGLGNADIPRFFKDATFGVRPARSSRRSPRAQA